MAQAFHLPLPHHCEHALVENIADAPQVGLLAGTGDLVLQLVTDIEMIGNRTLTAPRHKGDSGHTRLYGFLDPVLHPRVIYHWQHLLGHAFGGGEEASSIPCHRKQALFDHWLVSPARFQISYRCVRKYLHSEQCRPRQDKNPTVPQLIPGACGRDWPGGACGPAGCRSIRLR